MADRLTGSSTYIYKAAIAGVVVHCAVVERCGSGHRSVT